MNSDKLFNATIHYLKIVTLFATVMCVVMLYFQSFDPMHGLDGMIMNDLYGTTTMPDAARPLFNLMFLLFDWLSVLSMFTIYLVVRYGLAKKERWAYFAYLLIGVFWPLGAGVIAWYCGASSYYVSVAIMTVLFMPPAILLFPHFKKTNS
ncbi:MAG: hypothetical protein ACKVU0_03445 [Saprospiraceae bacterium]